MMKHGTLGKPFAYLHWCKTQEKEYFPLEGEYSLIVQISFLNFYAELLN